MNLDHIIAMAYVYSVTATLCDFTLGILPGFLVWNLQMNIRTKIALAGILGLGCMYDSLLTLCTRVKYLLVWK